MAKKTQTLADAIAFRQYAKTEKRKVGDAVDDPIADQLARAQNADEMAEIAVKGGIPRDVVEAKAKGAPNPGQFRMTLGNLLRGVLSRVEQYHSLTGGRVDAADVGTKKLFQQKMAEWRKANKPVKDGAKPSGKKSASKKGNKTPTKSGKSAGNGDAAAAPKGAPSKTEAAGRGKGKKCGGSAKKSRWQRNKANKQAGDDASAPSVDDQSGGSSEQTGLADAVADANA